MQVLNDKSGSTATAVADTSAANLGTLLLEDGGEGGDDTGTRGTERVANGNRAAVDVDFVSRKVEELHVGEGNDGEGLVDLVKVDIVLSETGVLDGLGDGGSRSDSEALRLTLGIGPAQNLGNGLNTELLDLGLGHEDNSGGTIIDGGGVGGGDGAVGLESRAHSLELSLVQVLDLIVAVNGDVGLATAAANLDRDNLLEETSLGGGLGLLVRVDSVLVLSFTSELVLDSAELGLETHVLLLVNIGQAILEDTVDESLVAVLGAVAEVGKVVRSVGHGLSSASDDNIGGAEHDVLGTEDDGLEGRSADLVDGGGNGGLGEAGAHGALACRSLAEAAGVVLVW